MTKTLCMALIPILAASVALATQETAPRKAAW
jgi:hypothetical protein